MACKQFKFSYFAVFFLSVIVLFSLDGCKSQKKLAAEREAAAKARQISKAKNDLKSLLADNTSTPEEKERVLNRIKSMNLEDSEVQRLINEVELMVAEEKEAALAEKERKLREEERRRKEQEDMLRKDSKAPTVYDFFDQIVGAGNNDSANDLIDNALDLFSSNDTPVLIIVSEGDGYTDYDKPTTIQKYLNYLKDQKKDLNEIKNIKFNDYGKIIELELKRK